MASMAERPIKRLRRLSTEDDDDSEGGDSWIESLKRSRDAEYNRYGTFRVVSLCRFLS